MMNEKEQIPARVGHASKDEGLSSGDDNAGKSTTAEAGAAGTAAARNGMTKDEYHLASLGYKQSFIRSLGILENWAATFTTMNFVSGMPQLFGFVMVRVLLPILSLCPSGEEDLWCVCVWSLVTVPFAPSANTCPMRRKAKAPYS